MPKMIREAVAVFDDAATLDDAVFALETHGFDRAAVSLLASEQAVAGKLGHGYRAVTEMEDEPRAPRETFFSRISLLEATYLPAPALAAIGALMLAGIGGTLPVFVAAGTGALVGAAIGRLVHRHHAVFIEEQLARGGLLLWVNVRDADEEEKALRILRAHSAHDVHVHEIAA